MTAQTPPIPESIGVVGAGTMGAGIAQLAAQAGARTLLYDPDPEALERGLAGIAKGLARQVERGRLSEEQAGAIQGHISTVSALEELGACAMIIEAAPERLEIKLEILGRLAEIAGPDCVLATNTSSLSVTEIAGAVPGSQRVVGMHFFNPAPAMRLVEVIAGEQTDAATAAITRAVGEAMGKRVIEAADVAGFLVNRVNRPFSLESLTILAQQLASTEEIDRIVRMGGGFRMGPFELMDLIGIETNHAVAEAFTRQTYGEPRYRPSPLAARKVAARQLGRKTGAGWYGYGEGSASRPADPDPPSAGGGDGRVVCVLGTLPIAGELLAAARAAGFDARADGTCDLWSAWLVLDCRDGGERLEGVAQALLLHRGSLHELDPTAAGFHVMPPFAATRLIEVTSTPLTDPVAAARLDELIAALGRRRQWVADAPGLVLGRILVALINEAAFLIGEGNGSAEDVDAGMELGLNHPRGPVAWSQSIGLAHVRALLEALHRELGEERYRLAPHLRRQSAIGASLADVIHRDRDRG
jgi:3-hydroxybutyryl-CoA dehydrogenase